MLANVISSVRWPHERFDLGYVRLQASDFSLSDALSNHDFLLVDQSAELRAHLPEFGQRAR